MFMEKQIEISGLLANILIKIWLRRYQIKKNLQRELNSLQQL